MHAQVEYGIILQLLISLLRLLLTTISLLLLIHSRFDVLRRLAAK